MLWGLVWVVKVLSSKEIRETTFENGSSADNGQRG